MARLDISNIDMNEIHVKVGGSSSSQVSLNDADVRDIGAPDATYAGSDGINTANNSTISIGEFRNAEHVSFGPWPSLASWDTTHVRSVSSGSYVQAECFAQISFADDRNNNRVIVSYYGGTNQSIATVYTQYVPYTGIAASNNSKIYVRYDGPSVYNSISNPLVNIGSSTSYSFNSYGWPGHSSQSTTASVTSSNHKKNLATGYELPSSGGYVPFKYFVRTDATQYSNQFRHVYHFNVNWTLYFTTGTSDNYGSPLGTGIVSVNSGDKSVELEAYKGAMF